MSKKRVRTKRVGVWLNEAEYMKLMELAEASGMKHEPLLRKMIMQERIDPRPSSSYPLLLKHMSAIGNNINQIARIANSEKSISYLQLKDVLSLLNTLWDAVRELR